MEQKTSTSAQQNNKSKERWEKVLIVLLLLLLGFLCVFCSSESALYFIDREQIVGNMQAKYQADYSPGVLIALAPIDRDQIIAELIKDEEALLTLLSVGAVAIVTLPQATAVPPPAIPTTAPSPTPTATAQPSANDPSATPQPTVASPTALASSTVSPKPTVLPSATVPLPSAQPTATSALPSPTSLPTSPTTVAPTLAPPTSAPPTSSPPTATSPATSNIPPVLTNDAISTPEDISVTFNVLSNDSDPDGSIVPGTLTIISGPSQGSLTTVNTSTGDITYQPNSDFNGIDTFTYQVCDNDGACSTASVTITVTPVNDAPIANDDTDSSTGTNAVAIDVAGNDTDVDGNLDINSVITLTNPSSGTLTIMGGGIISYTPSSNFSGIDTFTYRIFDTGLPILSDTATVTVTVTAINNPPVAIDDIDGTTGTNAVAIDVAGNDIDVDGNLDINSVITLTNPSSGTLTLLGGGVISYTPSSNFSGIDTFTYRIFDTGLLSDIATVTVTVTAINNPPIAIDDTDVTTGTNAVAIDVAGNDTDVDGNLDINSVITLTNPSSGTLTLLGGGVISYTPSSNFSGIDTFTYRIFDTGLLSDTATVTVTVTAINNPPVAIDDTDVTSGTNAVAIDVAGNDTDVDGNLDINSVITLTNPSSGTLTFLGGGVISYTPSSNFSGIDIFTYRIFDTGLLSDTATVTVTVTAINNPPVAIDDTDVTTGTRAVAIDVAANDSDIDGNLDINSVITLTNPTSGTLTLLGGGVISYTPNSIFGGIDTFTYRIFDTGVPILSDTAIVTVTVTAIMTNTSVVTCTGGIVGGSCNNATGPPDGTILEFTGVITLDFGLGQGIEDGPGDDMVFYESIFGPNVQMDYITIELSNDGITWYTVLDWDGIPGGVNGTNIDGEALDGPGEQENEIISTSILYPQPGGGTGITIDLSGVIPAVPGGLNFHLIRLSDPDPGGADPAQIDAIERLN